MNYEALNALLKQANVLNSTGNYDEAEQLATSVLAELEHASDASENQTLTERKTLHCSTLNSLAETNNRRGDFQAALALARTSLDIAEKYDLTQSKAKAWNRLGNVYISLGSYDKALECYEHAVAEHKELGDKSGVARVTANIGSVYQNLGSYDKALEFMEQALATQKELGELSFVAGVTGNIGHVYQNLGSYDMAMEFYEQALVAHKELGDKSGVAIVTGNIGLVYRNLGSYDKALEYYEQAHAAKKELGDKSGVASVIGNIGSVYISLGSYDKALEYFTNAIAIFDEIGEKQSKAYATGNIGMVYLNLGSYDKALEYFGKALTMFEVLGAKSGVAYATGNIGNVYLNLGTYDQALEYLGKALAMHEELGAKSGVAEATGNIGEVYKLLGDYHKALEYLGKALAMFEELGAKSSVAIALGNIGELYAKQAFDGYNPDKAEEFMLKGIALHQETGAKEYGIHKALAELYKAQKRWEEYSLHFENYYEIEKEVQSEEAKKSANLMEQRKQAAEREKEIELAKAAAAAKLNATTALLHRVLPESIATRMIAGEQDISDYFTSVTILFADIAGFTPISAGMPATMVVRFLNYVFGTFDTIMKKYGCEKIKTIGDGYMAVAGAPIQCDDHAERMALAALEMQEDIRLPEEFMEYLPAGTDFGIRIGLHTGSVVGGVIGDERFVYDIYSDAVNTAARMESHGEADKIHVSHEYYIHLQNRFAMTKNTTHGITFEKRGEMDIKGKGKMKTYFLEQAR